VKVRITVVKEMEMTEEDFEFLNDFILEGNTQAVDEMAQIDYDSEWSVEIVDRNKNE
jgi:hypothetical protein